MLMGSVSSRFNTVVWPQSEGGAGSNDAAPLLGAGRAPRRLPAAEQSDAGSVDGRRRQRGQRPQLSPARGRRDCNRRSKEYAVAWRRSPSRGRQCLSVTTLPILGQAVLVGDHPQRTGAAAAEERHGSNGSSPLLGADRARQQPPAAGAEQWRWRASVKIFAGRRRRR
jgi:hypothetical protein